MSYLTELNDILHELYGTKCVVVGSRETTGRHAIEVSRYKYEAAADLLCNGLASTVHRWHSSIAVPPDRISASDLVCVCLATHQYGFNHMNVKWKGATPSCYESMWIRIERAAQIDAGVRSLCAGRTPSGYAYNLCDVFPDVLDVVEPCKSPFESLTRCLDEMYESGHDTRELDYDEATDSSIDDFLRDYVPEPVATYGDEDDESQDLPDIALSFEPPTLHHTYEDGLITHLLK